MKWLATILGILLIILAVVYFITPANSLPGFLPGYDAALAKAHYKHGIASLILGLACFAFVWFDSQKPSPQKENTTGE